MPTYKCWKCNTRFQRGRRKSATSPTYCSSECKVDARVETLFAVQSGRIPRETLREHFLLGERVKTAIRQTWPSLAKYERDNGLRSAFVANVCNPELGKQQSRIIQLRDMARKLGCLV